MIKPNQKKPEAFRTEQNNAERNGTKQKPNKATDRSAFISENQETGAIFRWRSRMGMFLIVDTKRKFLRSPIV